MTLPYEIGADIYGATIGRRNLQRQARKAELMGLIGGGVAGAGLGGGGAYLLAKLLGAGKGGRLAAAAGGALLGGAGGAVGGANLANYLSARKIRG